MNTSRDDHDRTPPTEVIALANSAVLGLVIAINGPVPWPEEQGASSVIVYAFVTSLVLHAAARTGARAVVALGLATAVAGSLISVPYMLRTGLSATGSGGLFSFASALAALVLGLISRLDRAHSSPSTNHVLPANSHCAAEVTTSSRDRRAA